MAIVKIDGANEDDFKQKDFEPIPNGTYLFEVTGPDNGPLRVEKAKSSDNNVVNVVLVCADEGEFKGKKVFDTLTINAKAQWKLCHLAMAAGVPKETVQNEGVDLDAILHQHVKATIGTEAAKTLPDGTEAKARNRVSQYLFETEEQAE